MSSNIPLVVPNHKDKEVEGLQKVTELEDRNLDFHYNHSFILKAVNESLDEGFIPSVTYIAERSGFSRKTVYKHIPYISCFMNSQDKELIKARRIRLLEKVYEEAISGSIQSLKAIDMYMKFTENSRVNSENGTIIKFGEQQIEI